MKKIPKLRFLEFNEMWKEKKLEEICDKSIEKNKQNIIKIVFSNSAKYGIVLQNDFFDREITTEANQDNYYIVKPNSFVYNPRISQNAPVGPVSINKTGLIGIVSPLYTIFNLKEESFVNKEYLEMYFMTNKWHGYLKSVANTGARHDRMNITDSQLFKLPIFIPSLLEQEKIASFLLEVNKSIEVLEQEKELWEKYKKGMMEKIFSQKLRFKDENGNDYPKWEEKTLGDISSNVMYGMNAAATEFDGQNKYIRITDISEASNKFIPNPLSSPLASLEERFLVNENDILFARTGASTGKSYLYDSKDGILYYAGFLIRFNINKENNSKYIFYQTLTKKYQNWLKIMSMRSGQPGINAEEYKGFEMDIPSLPEQEKIANFLSTIDEKIELVEEELELVKELKKGFLQKMFV